MKIIDVYNNFITENQWLIDIPPLHEILENSGYNTNHSYIDKYFSRLYADLLIDSDILNDDITYNELELEITSCLYSNIEYIKRIYEIETSNYNLLDNVDRYEILDKQTIKNINGKQKNTNTSNKIINSVTNKVSGFNSNELVIDNETTTTTSGNAGGAIVNTSEIDEYINSQEILGTEADGKIFNHIHGNIGVTKSTELLDAHADFWNNFNFFEKVLKSLFNYLCVGVYE